MTETDGVQITAPAGDRYDEILTGEAPGRQAAGELTIFESLGLAIEDLAAAGCAYDLAAATGRGSWVEF